jgi:hypothetical protein
MFVTRGLIHGSHIMPGAFGFVVSVGVLASEQASRRKQDKRL